MARKRRHRQSERDAYDVARQSLHHVVSRPIRALAVTTPLRSLEDRRTWYPEPAIRPALTFRGARHSLEAAPVSPRQSRRSRLYVPHQVMFAQSAQVVVCAKRKVRRETLFATGKIKRGAGRKHRPHRNSLSHIRCR